MPRAIVNEGIELEYDTLGNPEDPALLLIMGFSAQMTQWADGFRQMLANAGRYVIRFDNRDCGLSTKLDGVLVEVDKVIKAAMFDEPTPPVPYTLSDMAADAVGLLNHLGIAKVHVLGVSMGGMIAQVFAIEHPDRILTLTSVMSQPGDPEVGQSTPEAIEALLTPPPTDREAYIESSKSWLVWHSKKYRNPEKTRRDAARDYDRSFYPEGTQRQLAAIYASGRRSELLKQLSVPTLVIHGNDDTLIAPDGGQRTAELIPGAHLLMVADMGHDLPEPLWPLFAGAVIGLTSINI